MPRCEALRVMRPWQDTGNDVVALQQALAAARVDFNGRLKGGQHARCASASTHTESKSGSGPANRRTREAIDRTRAGSASPQSLQQRDQLSDGSRRVAIRCDNRFVYFCRLFENMKTPDLIQNTPYDYLLS